MLNPILELEDKVQVKDQTRFNAMKSIATKGENPITQVRIKPGADGTEVNVFVANEPDQWFLDWLWSDAKFDIDAAFHKLYFKRVSTGDEFEVTLTTNTYTFTGLVAHIETQLNAASPIVWDLSLGLKDKIEGTVNESVEVQFNKNPVMNLWPLIGFPYRVTGKDILGETIEAGLRKITVSLVNQDLTNPMVPVDNPPVSESFWQKVYTPYGDGLFSTDQEIKIHEATIMDWVPQGRASWLNVHRRSQETILNWIYQAGHTDRFARRLTKYDILDLEDVRLWSVYETLYFLFMSFQNSENDVFKEKAQYYEKQMLAARNTALLKLDKNKTGKVEDAKRVNTGGGLLFRR